MRHLSCIPNRANAGKENGKNSTGKKAYLVS